MGFIELVTERLENAESFSRFKHLISAYNIAIKADVCVPKMYLVVPAVEMKEFHWGKALRRLPNLFVMRPSVFVNSRFDYLLRDDGDKGFLNFTLNTQATQDEVLKQQQDNLESLTMDGRTEPTMLFEEFPIGKSNALEYPLHYRVHAFHDYIALVQATSRHAMCWLDPGGAIVGQTTEAKLGHYVPEDNDMGELVQAATNLSLATELPYVRMDFVLSSRGPMIRSFACVPGDVRAEQFRWFYKKYDEEFAKHWRIAELKLKGDALNGLCDSGRTTVDECVTPDDNA